MKFNKNKRLEVRVSDLEHNIISAKAKQNGLTISEYVRQSSLNNRTSKIENASMLNTAVNFFNYLRYFKK